MGEKVWVALCKMRLEDDKELLLLMMEKGGSSVSAWKSEREALDFFEEVYNGCHKRDATWSASAVVNWLSYRYSVVAVSGLQELRQHIVAEDSRIVVGSNVAGRVTGATTRPGALEYWERGAKPRLIGGGLPNE